MKIIVLDNFSTENLKVVADSFEDDRIYYIRNEKVLENFNKAIDICDTEYLCIFHDDDRMFPWMIEKLVESLDENPSAALACSDRMYVMGQRLKPRRPGGIPGILYKKNELIKEFCETGEDRVVCPSVMFRKKNIASENMRFRAEVGAAADLYFWLEANNRGLPIYVLNCPLLEYRRHLGSDTLSRGHEMWLFTYQKVDDFITGLNLGYDMGKVRGNFAKAIIMYVARGMAGDFDSKLARDVRSMLEDEMKWFISDDSFYDSIAIGYLGDSISGVGLGKIGLSEYFAKEKILRQSGIDIPFMRRVKWYVKYILMQRFCGLRSS
jgi:glycosyltransferase involved in cell wall biosynthesis